MSAANHARELVALVAKLLGAPVEEILALDLPTFDACLLYLFGKRTGIDTTRKLR